MRENVVVSNDPVAARFRKLRTDSGALAGSISITMAPCSVSKVTHWPVISSTAAPSNGSGFVCGHAVGRALAFFSASLFGVGFWATVFVQNEMTQVRLVKTID